MPKAMKANADEIQWNGAGTIILHSGRLTNAAAAQYGAFIVAPCDLYIHSVHYYIDTGFTHASSKLNLGSVTDDDAFIDGITLQSVATGAYEADMAAATTILRRIPKGTAVAFSLDAADTTGKISATAVLVPYNPAT